MAEDDLKNLIKLRADIVDYRRAFAEKAVEGDFLNGAANVVDMQNRIEAIDRAIADEKKLSQKPYTLDNVVGKHGD